MASSAVNQRKIAAVMGAIVADAAVQPMHWIYNMETMKNLTEGVEELEFRDPSANPFYRIPTGSNTCYGDQAFVMLKSLAKCKGLSIEDLKQETYQAFGPDSCYENEEINKYKVGKEDKINVKKSLPISQPWRNGCIKDFLSNMNKGLEETGSPTDDQIDCIIRVIPLVCLYAGHADMLMKVENGLRVTQASDLAIACALAAARILEQYILHGNPSEVLKRVIEDIESPKNTHPQDMDKAVIGQLRRVQQVKDVPHKDAVPTHFQNN